ncbi:uncharacterized protein [Triticum aestivum]|uniref:uncharacterized protein n=1 Tax=Triticum aestivum TaxID=4565 RepID=UPI001D006742|nr:uncharacterized protein LOC123093899 [Triticum aestivum]
MISHQMFLKVEAVVSCIRFHNILFPNKLPFLKLTRWWWVPHSGYGGTTNGQDNTERQDAALIQRCGKGLTSEDVKFRGWWLGGEDYGCNALGDVAVRDLALVSLFQEQSVSMRTCFLLPVVDKYANSKP